MSALPAGTVTFLFTDIEGSTRLLGELLGAIDARLSPHGRMFREEAIAAFEAALTDAELAKASKAGRAMSIDEAVAYALETIRSAAAGKGPRAG
jgi:hypothetical protein